MWWRFEIIYNPGKDQLAAGALSRMKPLHTLYLNADTEEVEHDTRDIMETDLLTLNEAVHDAYEDDGMPRATQEEEALAKLLDIIKRGIYKPIFPNCSATDTSVGTTAPPTPPSTPPTLTPPTVRQKIRRSIRRSQ